MMYGLSNTEPAKSPFPISESVSNVQLKSCSYVKGENWEAIDFEYFRKTDDGVSSLRDRVFSINPNTVTPSPSIEGDTKEKALEREVKRLNSRLKHIASKFILDKTELLSITGSTFAEYAKNYCAAVNKECPGVLLYCKTVRDSSGYPKMAKYPDFLQRMDSGRSELTYRDWEINQNANNTPSSGASEASRIPPQTNWVSN